MRKGFHGALLSKLAGPLMKVGVPSAENVLASLATMLLAPAIDDAIQRKCVKEEVLQEQEKEIL